jgi:hypothetical protein
MNAGVPWEDERGVVALPSGLRVRGRPIDRPASPADYTLVLTGRGEPPAWTHRRVRWPDFWIPVDRRDALDALHEAYDLACLGERVEAVCHGGRGRTGTALAALAILDGVDATEAFRWVRAAYDPRAVEMPWQRWWLRVVR